MPDLFSPLKLRGITLRNRIGVSPMCQYSSVDGFVDDWHLVHLGSRAVGGAGLIIAEASAVDPAGRISINDAGIWSDTHIEPFARATHFMKKHGAVAGIQLAHAGRKAGFNRPWDEDTHQLTDDEGGWPTVAPSPLPFNERTWRVPKELSRDDIRTVQTRFREAAVRALEAGFEWVELHGAHGYLAHSFLSPLSNHRTDEYGGNFDNRVRFVLEIVQEIRSVWPDDKPLSVRLSCSDWAEDGWTIEDSVALSRRLKTEGVDLVDCSSGGAIPDARIPVGASFQVPFAEQIRREADIPTAAVGVITAPMQADDIIRTGRADVVLLAREMLRDPYWPLRAAKTLHCLDRLDFPPQYERAL